MREDAPHRIRQSRSYSGREQSFAHSGVLRKTARDLLRFRGVIREEFLGFTGGDSFMEIVVHHADRRTASGSEALSKLHGKFPAG
jgi:hypothetical protein